MTEIIIKLRSICNLKYSIPEEIPVVFNNGLNYDCHFIIKQLAKEFEGKFNCVEDSTGKLKTFSVPVIKEVTRIDKNGKENTKTINHLPLKITIY